MDEKEQEEAVPRLRQQGNAFVKEKKFQEASVKYGEALSILENSSLKEKVGGRLFVTLVIWRKVTHILHVLGWIGTVNGDWSVGTDRRTGKAGCRVA